MLRSPDDDAVRPNRGTSVVVVITAVGSTTALSVVKALRMQRELPVRIVGTDTHERHEIAGSSACDAFYTVPGSDDLAFVPTLLEVCRRERARVLFPIVDPEILAVAAQHVSFEALGVQPWVAAEKAVRVCNDKLETYRALVQHGFPTPATWTPEEAASLSSEAFPLIVKPVDGVSSRDVWMVADTDELAVALRRVPNAVVQEFAPGREFTVDVVADAGGRPMAAVPRERLEVKAGISTKGRTVRDDRLSGMACDVVDALNLAGPSNVQFRVDGEVVRVLEINPRFSAALTLSVASGVNSPLLLLKLTLGETISPDECDFEAGVSMTRYWEECFYRPPAAGGSPTR